MLSEWIWEQWQRTGSPHSSKLQHYWSLTIRLFSVISGALVGRGVRLLCSRSNLPPPRLQGTTFRMKSVLKLKRRSQRGIKIIQCTLIPYLKKLFDQWKTRCKSIYIYHHHHHHHVVLEALISLTLCRYFSLSFIASGRSSGQHPVSSHNCWMYVRAGRPAFARPYVGVHKSTSLMSSSLLLQQCPACLVRLAWIVFVIGGRWPYCWCLVGCCRQDLFKIARRILV